MFQRLFKVLTLHRLCLFLNTFNNVDIQPLQVHKLLNVLSNLSRYSSSVARFHTTYSLFLLLISSVTVENLILSIVVVSKCKPTESMKYKKIMVVVLMIVEQRVTCVYD